MRKKTVMVEVDVFYPKGKTINDWDFIKSMRLEVSSDNIEADSENVGLDVKRAIAEWLKEQK